MGRKELKTFEEDPYLDIVERAIKSHKKAGKPCQHLEGVVDQKRSKIRRMKAKVEQLASQAQERRKAHDKWVDEIGLEMQKRKNSIMSKLNSSVSFYEFRAFVLISSWTSRGARRRRSILKAYQWPC